MVDFIYFIDDDDLYLNDNRAQYNRINVKFSFIVFLNLFKDFNCRFQEIILILKMNMIYLYYRLEMTNV